MRIIGFAILGIAAIGALVLAYMAIQGWRTSNKVTAHREGLPLKGDLTKKQEQRLIRHNDRAAVILSDLGRNNDHITAVEDIEVITDIHREAINRWLAEYTGTVNTKPRNRT